MAIASIEPGLQTLAIDAAHSEVSFQVRHLLTKVRGRFGKVSGTLQLDNEQPERSSVSVNIEAASIDTGTADRDVHLRSADFFEVERFPSIGFVSTRVEQTADDEFKVTGELTLHGVTRPVTISATALGVARDPWGNVRAAFEGTTTLNRKDFGLNWNAALETGGFLVGDEVKVTLSIQAVVQ